MGAIAALAGALLVAGAALAFVAARGPEPPRTLAERTRAVAETLRCPVCQDLSVADSPSEVARQMRATISRELRAGATPAQITGGFVRAYGQWMLLSPPKSGIDLVAWIAPALLVLAGLALAAVAVRRWAPGKGASRQPPTEPALDESDRGLLRVALASAEDDVD